MLDIAMPNKVKLLALKTLLSARFAEGRIIVVDNDYIPEMKTKNITKALDSFNKKERIIYITAYKNDDFKLASRNVGRMTYTTFNEVRLTDILKSDKVMFNLDGLLYMMRYIHEQTVILHKPKAIQFTGVVTEELKRLALEEKNKDKLVYEEVLWSNIAHP